MTKTLTERAAVVRALPWTWDAVNLGGPCGIPEKAWAASLGVVLTDVLGVEVAAVLGVLTRWCEAQPYPEKAAERLAKLAVYAERGTAMEALLDFATG